MQLSVLMTRARSALGKATRYKSPDTTPLLNAASWPASGAKIDCSGFPAWCLRISRKVDHPKYEAINGGWFETTGIHADIANSWGFFEPLTVPKVGAFLVYPDKNGHEGHMGIVSAVNGKAGLNGVTHVIHCSASGWNQHGDAIRETGPQIWAAHPDTLIGWHTGVT